ncbi:MAG TPA: AAA family ATPase [Caulobacteraceae bacterium]|jgi:ATP-dependent Clp protease ATP-binding subunit ClpA|nr:AAA family ATPase [Caulobacteraceae bacterium]
MIANPWLERIFVVLGMLAITQASPLLALVFVSLATLAVLTVFLVKGRYLPEFAMDVLDRLTDRQALEKAYAAKKNELVTIDATALADRLKAKVIGQDATIASIATSLRRRVAARRKDKPMAVFCLCGPAGVGKSHLAKTVAEALYGDRNHLHFFDMSQFGQPHAAASLFGQAKGYVGSGSYGSLTAALRDTPNAVVLLDEFEKAHPEVHKRFLTAWNDGFVTEVSDGAKISTSEAIFVLTTNAAAGRIGEMAAAHQGTAEELDRLTKSALLDAQFAPEVLSRIDEAFAFRPLAGLDIARVVALEIEAQAAQYGLKIQNGGIDPRILLGAVERLSGPMQGGVRDISRAIERDVANGLIDSRAAGAEEIKLIDRDGKIQVLARTPRPPEAAPRAAGRPAA